MAQVKAGDVVHVRLRVKEIRPGSSSTALCVEESSGDEFVSYLTSIVHVEPRALQVGDKVRDKEGDVAEIVAMRRDEVWLDFGPDNIDCVTMSMSDVNEMERVV